MYHFNPFLYTLCIRVKENKPVGTSILQLVVTDKDSFHNGPPFTFTILTGNEEEEFTLDPNGVLRSAVIFRHMVATEYVLCVQVRLHFLHLHRKKKLIVSGHVYVAVWVGFNWL